MDNIAGVNNEGFIEIISDCLNCVDSRLIDHGLRVANMTYRILEAQNGYDQKYLQDVFMLAMLHDIGAYKTEEIDKMFQFETKNIWQHSIYGYLFLKNFSPLEELAAAVLYHHLDFDKMIYVDEKTKNIAQIINLCDRIDVYLQVEKSVQGLEACLNFEKKTRFKSELVDLFWQVDQQYQFTSMPFSNWTKVTGLNISLSLKELDRYLEMLVSLIDFRSHFTVTHTITTCTVSLQLAKRFNLDKGQTTKIYYGAMMHDLGKIAIPIEILEYPGKLSKEAMVIMRGHVVETKSLLENRIDQEILEIACRHHEKLNGLGYPDGLKADDLTCEQRIVAVSDIVSALCGKRSYKSSFSKEETCRILSQMAQNGELDRDIVEQVIINYDLIAGEILKEAVGVLETYNTIIVTYNDLLKKKNELSSQSWLKLLSEYLKTDIVNLQIDD